MAKGLLLFNGTLDLVHAETLVVADAKTRAAGEGFRSNVVAPGRWELQWRSYLDRAASL